MILPYDRGYFQGSSSDPPHAFNYFDQYLEATQSSYSSDDSIGGQWEGLSFAAAPDPTWFSDWILYTPDDQSNDFNFQAVPMSVSSTSGSVRMDLSSDIATTPPLALSPGSVPMSTDTNILNDIVFYPGQYPTELDDADYALVFGSNMPDLPWNPKEPAVDLSACSHSESPSSEKSEQSSPEDSTFAQNDAAGKLSLPPMRYFKCPTCPSRYLSELKLSEHLRKSHAPARFTCVTCDRGFKLEKDLKRHYSTHEPSKPSFACTCTRTYQRYDGLLRHIAKRSQEAGRHKAVESNPR